MGASKGIWIFRVVFYGAAAMFVGWYLWTRADAHPSVKPVPQLIGVTSQRRPVALGAGGKGIRSFATTFRVRCTDGEQWVWHWWPNGVHFHNRGRAFYAHERSNGVMRSGVRWQTESSVTGLTSPDRRTASGNASVIGEYWRSGYRSTTECDSGPVRWSVRR